MKLLELCTVSVFTDRTGPIHIDKDQDRTNKKKVGLDRTERSNKKQDLIGSELIRGLLVLQFDTSTHQNTCRRFTLQRLEIKNNYLCFI